MARYRKVDVRIWVDERVRRLSKLPACGQGLWFYLLTNPQTTNIPGLYRAGEAAMAEELGWSLKGFREAFAELSRAGLAKADWSARVVWIPGAIKYNQPDNPNVVKGWAQPWDEIPDCDLKRQAWETLKGFLEGLGEPFAKPFTERCAKSSANSLPNGLGAGLAIQEQEQEQEQEQDPPIAPRGGEEGFAEFWLLFPRKVGKDKAREAWRKKRPALEAVKAALAWQVVSDGWTKDGGRYVPNPATYLNQGRWQDEPPSSAIQAQQRTPTLVPADWPKAKQL